MPRRRSKTPYLDAAIQVFEHGGYSCEAVNDASPPPKGTLLHWGNATRRYARTFVPACPAHTLPRECTRWWNAPPHHDSAIDCRVWALLLAHAMSATNDLME